MVSQHGPSAARIRIRPSWQQLDQRVASRFSAPNAADLGGCSVSASYASSLPHSDSTAPWWLPIAIVAPSRARSENFRATATYCWWSTLCVYLFQSFHSFCCFHPFYLDRLVDPYELCLPLVTSFVPLTRWHVYSHHSSQRRHSKSQPMPLPQHLVGVNFQAPRPKLLEP